MANLTVADACNLYKSRGWLLVPGAGVVLRRVDDIAYFNYNNQGTQDRPNRFSYMYIVHKCQNMNLVRHLLYIGCNLKPDGACTRSTSTKPIRDRRDAKNNNICFDPFLLPLLKWNDEILVTIHVVNEKILIAGNMGSPFYLTGHRSLELLTNWQTGHKFTSEDIVKVPVLGNGANDSLGHCVLLECGLKIPNCPAFIVKGRGLFVWGDTVEHTMEACDAIAMMICVILYSRRQPN